MSIRRTTAVVVVLGVIILTSSVIYTFKSSIKANNLRRGNQLSHLAEDPSFEPSDNPESAFNASSSSSSVSALQYVQMIAPLPLTIKNPFLVPEHNPPYDPKVEKMKGTIEEFILNYEETNQLVERFKIPVQEEWFDFDPLPYRQEACIASQTLCKALKVLDDLAAGKQPFVEGSKEIPQVIHQTARTKTDRSQPFMKRSVESFKQLNGHYLHLFWSDEDIKAMLTYCYPQLESLFHALPIKVMKADYFRYLVVHKFGGIYADVDCVCLKPADQWLQMDSLPEVNGKLIHAEPGHVEAVFGVESDLIYLYKDEPGRELDNLFFPHPAGFGQFVFMGAPESEVMRDIVANTTQNLMYLLSLTPEDWNKLQIQMKRMVVLEMTGPGVVSAVVHSHLSQYSGLHWSDLSYLKSPFTAGLIRIHPITAFGNGIYRFMGQGSPQDSQALVQHLFAGSWK
eukprot:TRINITY_DN16939_c0_g1_i1.p1 TRINITY_DN16939_c0_g1~~TRINITY_DN16939_c0_g1_i1.p1  ORF type:complete len:454 (-),score=88.81 TRINITY_DN16939_c0_g1_i1:32-1393(-)